MKSVNTTVRALSIGKRRSAKSRPARAATGQVFTRSLSANQSAIAANEAITLRVRSAASARQMISQPVITTSFLLSQLLPLLLDNAVKLIEQAAVALADSLNEMQQQRLGIGAKQPLNDFFGNRLLELLA